ncbi:hypothetical protein EIP86_009394 [Pleurotus ostreatoroseus]|nr:hypothetical protein EIP86_009394 [Pleurotus ostreatoroseus]
MPFYPRDFERSRRNDDDNYDREWDELGKELREYDETMVKNRCHFTSSPEYIRVRYHRWQNFHQWHVFDMEAAMMTLLQTALSLFSIGLGGLLLKLNIVVGGVIVTCIALWMLFISISILAPFVSSRCPYKILFFTALASQVRHAISEYLGREPWNEAEVRKRREFDVPAILAADEAFGDDQLLLKTLRPCVATVKGQDAIKFLQAILFHRLRPSQGPNDDWPIRPHHLSRLTNPALKAILHILLDALEAEFSDKVDVLFEPPYGDVVTLNWKPQYHWIAEGLYLLFDVLLHASTKHRYLGEAMDRGVSLPLMILPLESNFLCMKCIELLVEYNDVPYELWDLDQEATTRAVCNARQLVKLGRITLLQMTRVILSMIPLRPQHKLVDIRDFSSHLSSLNEQLQAEAHVSYDEASAKACLRTCNMIKTRTQDQALIAWADRLIETLNSLN